MTKREQAKALKELYAELPRAKCQGKCANSCGPILFSDYERDEIQAKSRRQLTIAPHPIVGGLPMCSMLTADGDCSVYDIRPMICRLWGAVPEMPCEHCCEVVNPVPKGKVFEFLAEAMRIGGDEHARILKPYVEIAARMARALAAS